MNSKLKGIIVCIVVLVGLGGTLAVLKLTGADTADDSSADSSETEASTSSEDESVQLVDMDASDVVSVVAENENGTFTYYHDTETGKDTTGIKELDGLELDSNMVSDLASDASQLTAYKLVEEDASDLEKYGLSEPIAKFTVTFTDGGERTFEIGDTAPQNRYCYFKEADSNDVYMMLYSTVQYYTYGKESFVETTLLETPDDDMPDFGTLTIARTSYDYDMVFQQDSEEVNSKVSENMASQQVMTSPIFSYLNVDTATDMLYGLYGLTAAEAVEVFPDEDALKEYGLDDPQTTVTFVGDGYDYTLTIGNEYHELNDDGEEQTSVSAYYCYFEGVSGKDCIWKIDASALPWVTLEPGDVVTSMMTWNMVTDVDNIKVYGDDVDDIEMSPTVEEDEDGDEDLASVTVNGNEADVETFKSFYMYILTCPTSELIFDLPEGNPYLTLEINCEGDDSDVIEFYKDTERRSIAVLNGKTPYRIKTSWTDRMVQNAEAVRDGGEVVDTY
jgi:hypothetical protein